MPRLVRARQSRAFVPPPYLGGAVGWGTTFGTPFNA